MSLRRQAAASLARMIDLECSLAQPTTVIAAPPSAVADSPACAVWLEKFTPEWHADEEIEVDEDGVPLTGANARLSGGRLAMIDSATYLSKVGTLRCKGRIWAGSRLAPKREEIEGKITMLFARDRSAPSRLLLTLAKPSVSGYRLPFDWTVAAFVESFEWSDEFAFTERLWTWISFDLDVDILIPRNDPIAARIILMVTEDLETEVETTTDLDALDLETWSVGSDGSLTPQP